MCAHMYEDGRRERERGRESESREGGRKGEGERREGRGINRGREEEGERGQGGREGRREGHIIIHLRVCTWSLFVYAYYYVCVAQIAPSTKTLEEKQLQTANTWLI